MLPLASTSITSAATERIFSLAGSAGLNITALKKATTTITPTTTTTTQQQPQQQQQRRRQQQQQ